MFRLFQRRPGKSFPGSRLSESQIHVGDQPPRNDSVLMKREDIIIKYPRTPHIQGSRLQPGDEDLRQRRFSEIKGRHIVLEEKIDGANSAISFTDDGELRLQSRGHFLSGGAREKHYDLLKQWAAVHRDRFYEVLGNHLLKALKRTHAELLHTFSAGKRCIPALL